VRKVFIELLFASALGLLLLALGAWQQLSAMSNLTADWGQLRALLGLNLSGTPLGGEVMKFVVAQVALHLGLGLVVWLLAWLSGRAFVWPRGRRPAVMCLWFVAIVAWVLVANGTLFPWSVTGFSSELLQVHLLGSARLLELLSIVLLVALLVVAVRATRSFGIRLTTARVAVYSLALLLAYLVPVALRHAHEFDGEGAPTDKPNLVLIGIDSLRSDVVGAGRSPGLTPHIDAFVRDGSQLFNDATTPLARTFPAWTSILTGLNPRSTGAREDLMARSALQPVQTLADTLRTNGYRTIFAMDDVRFANIDQSFGFDQVITPTIGAADFLLGKANDLPLTNLIANTWLGKWLFPATYGNRAANVTYRPDTFLSWLDSEIEPRGPTMLAVHFTLPHHPYTWSAPAEEVFSRVTDKAYLYSNAVIAADRQFGMLMELLERKGMLRNSLVVLLSDHGEALGLPQTDALIRGNTVREILDGYRISLWGHGSSVLSPHQFAAFLALRGYGSVDLPHAFHEYDAPVSLVDIAPTALDLLGLRTSQRFDGASLRPVIAGDNQAIARFTARVRFTETGFRTPRIADGDFNERSVLGDTAAFFRMNPATGRFEVRQELMPVLLADKERAAMTGDWLLAALPSRSDSKVLQYVLTNRHDGTARRLESAPGADDKDAFVLWQALHQEYGDELLPPAKRLAPLVATDN